MKIVHAVSSIDMETSGTSYAVPRLARALVARGHAADVVTLGAAGTEVDAGVRIIRCERDQLRLRRLIKLGRSGEMRTALVNPADVFHTHGLWMMPNIYPAEAARRAGKPFVLSPHGMFGRDALKFSATAKRLFWFTWQKHAVDAVSCFHATADSEYDDIRAFGLRQPVAVIPNGIDLPDLADLGDACLSDTAPADDPFVLSLGRIHPKKGLDRLIAAFALVAHDHPEWRLRIIGPDERGHAGELVRQVAACGLAGRVSLEPPVFGADKFRLMRQAEVFALSTLHENFGMTVAESLAVETPVISTRGAPWAGLQEHRCGWWIDHGSEAMAGALREAMAMPREARREMGGRGRVWMQRDFGWDGIGGKMTALYQWLLDRGSMPPTVRLD